MVKNAPQDNKISLFGPAPAPIFMMRGVYRYRFLIKTERKILPQSFVKAWLQNLKIPHTIKIHIDVDPISFL
jgi:primosomal protein N' (replication factor Y)